MKSQLVLAEDSAIVTDEFEYPVDHRTVGFDEDVATGIADASFY